MGRLRRNRPVRAAAKRLFGAGSGLPSLNSASGAKLPEKTNLPAVDTSPGPNDHGAKAIW
jgi:hypothetical protein